MLLYTFHIRIVPLTSLTKGGHSTECNSVAQVTNAFSQLTTHYSSASKYN